MNIVGILRRRLATGVARNRYPASDHPPAPTFRGAPEMRPGACDGSATCAAVCPTGAVRVDHAGPDWSWRLDLASCTGCGLCVDACPQDALGVSPAFELASRSRADLLTTVEFRGAGDAKHGAHE